MKITCVSDLHGFYPDLSGGDLLIVAGDLTARDTVFEHVKFMGWLERQIYRKKIVIAGNHDVLIQKTGFLSEHLPPKTEYLLDSGTEFDGLLIWGTPWTPWFHGVNPKCKAFMRTDRDIKKKFALIPDNTDILISHGPMLHILDSNIDGYACGSHSLRDNVDRVKPKLMVFGHIHEQGGNQLMYKHQGKNTWCVNCSLLDERYNPVNEPMEIEL